MNDTCALLEVKAATRKLLAYCRAHEWSGYDPYDALNSEIFKIAPILNSRVPRLILTQAMKRSPINIRPLVGIPPTQNPKAMALFLSAFLKLSAAGVEECEGLAEQMIERLIALRSPGVPYWCWGYSFPWQTRTIVVPRGFPNLVCTIFVANALLDAYELHQDPRCLELAVSAGEYILSELFWSEGGVSSFSYPLPNLRTPIHNANFLGAALLCRIYKHSAERKFVDPALGAARYSAAQQHADGSWNYGDAPTQRWVDNFHTGYNLCALRSLGQMLETAEFEPFVLRGFRFYLDHFFRKDGAPRYFHDCTYPIDVHCVAQSIITLLTFKDLDPASVPTANKVLGWAVNHMWDERGFFYYRVLRSCTIKTSYMRWSQAWMMLALSTLLLESAVASGHTGRQQSLASLGA
jgi:hypothetical protein